MDIFGIYAVKDELTNKFMQPFYYETDSEATRTFKTNVNNIKIWHDNPSDYSLYRLGSFDQSNGNITSELEKVVNGRSVVDG